MNRTGDLIFGQACIGSKVRCVAEPSLSPWSDRFKLVNFFFPNKGRIYVVRSNVCGVAFGVMMKGILLIEIKNQECNLDDLLGEPFFPCGAFNYVG